MNWFRSAEKDVQGVWSERAPLAALTTMGVGGPARWLAKPATPDDALRVRRIAQQEGVETAVLGGGSNILVSDSGVDALVVQLDSDEFRRIDSDGADRVWMVGAGARLSRVVRAAADAGLSGLEPLAGIPGTVGAALSMNAGGKNGEIGSRVAWVDALIDGERRRLTQEDAGFVYRGSKLASAWVIGCGLKLTASDPSAVASLTREILDAKRASQPLAAQSAGCVFKNPPNDGAGRLIDAAGMKGARCGGARISDQHANFILNDGTATATDVMTLIGCARRSVFEQFRIKLELEVLPWGNWTRAC